MMSIQKNVSRPLERIDMHAFVMGIGVPTTKIEFMEALDADKIPETYTFLQHFFLKWDIRKDHESFLAEKQVHGRYWKIYKKFRLLYKFWARYKKQFRKNILINPLWIIRISGIRMVSLRFDQNEAHKAILDPAFFRGKDLVVLFTHGYKDHIEIDNQMIPVDRLLDCIPESFSGVFELCVCNPDALGFNIKRERKNCFVSYRLTDLTPIIWLTFYANLFKYIKENQGNRRSSYLQAFVETHKRFAREFSTKQKVKLNLIGIYTLCVQYQETGYLLSIGSRKEYLEHTKGLSAQDLLDTIIELIQRDTSSENAIVPKVQPCIKLKLMNFPSELKKEGFAAFLAIQLLWSGIDISIEIIRN